MSESESRPEESREGSLSDDEAPQYLVSNPVRINSTSCNTVQISMRKGVNHPHLHAYVFCVTD